MDWPVPGNAEWHAYREEWDGDDPDRLEEMNRLSDLLCTIEGVARPASPSAVANAHPNQRFELFDVPPAAKG